MTSWREEQEALEASWFTNAAKGVRDTFVYRYHDTEGQLLYVGQTKDFDRRDKAHQSRTWYGDVAAKTVEGPHAHAIALALEWDALNHESPTNNRTTENGYRGPGSVPWLVEQSEEYQRRLELDPMFDHEAWSEVLDSFMRMRHEPAA